MRGGEVLAEARCDIDGVALEAEAPEQSAQAVTHGAIELAVELSLATSGQGFLSLAFGREHGGASDKLPLPLAKPLLAAEVGGDVVD